MTDWENKQIKNNWFLTTDSLRSLALWGPLATLLQHLPAGRSQEDVCSCFLSKLNYELWTESPAPRQRLCWWWLAQDIHPAVGVYAWASRLSQSCLPRLPPGRTPWDPSPHQSSHALKVCKTSPSFSPRFLFVLSEPERITEAIEQANEISWSSSLGCESLGPAIHRDAAVASVSMGTYSLRIPISAVCLPQVPHQGLSHLHPWCSPPVSLGWKNNLGIIWCWRGVGVLYILANDLSFTFLICMMHIIAM